MNDLEQLLHEKVDSVLFECVAGSRAYGTDMLTSNDAGLMPPIDFRRARRHTPRPMFRTPNLLCLELSLPHAGREGRA